MLAGRRFRLELTEEQDRLAQQTADVCRAVWNIGLEQRREYRRRGAWMNYVPQAAELVDAKAEHPWLRQVPGHCLQQTLMDLDKACRRHGTFGVHWRSSRRWVPSFRFPEGNKMELQKLNCNKSRLKLPKLGWVKFRSSRSLDGEAIRSATLTKEGRHWYVSVLVDDGVVAPENHGAPDAEVGVDRGVVVAVATSDGDLLDQVFSTAAEQRRAVRLQRKLSRAAKRSANRNKTRQRYAGLRAKEARRRQDFCVKTARVLAEKNAVVVLEKLPAKNMTLRAKPVADPNNPGCYLPNGAAGKSGLNKAILSKGWYRFELALKSVSRYTGTKVVKVPAAFTSQRCSVCKHVDPKSRESQAVFRCTHCSHGEHADINAAKVILAAGRALGLKADSQNACGDDP
ncbi:RNA-guided endonuclease InsQ/TnpB family protein [Mycobacterium riyadhense]|uniref:Putative transposase n=1 Tax=Mycobacterium riyadhense TaxID=486698 RepID=A0A653ETY9_9MYCO|nr:transposase [Mycobacterium riyadhense]VTP00808.1 putative transposase [Mycobacterium riyadhense]